MTLMRVSKTTRKRAEEIQKRLYKFYGKKIPRTKIIEYQMQKPFVIADSDVKNLKAWRKKIK